MIIRWPDGARGQIRDELVSTIDLFPTFCDIAGVEAPHNLPGQSLEAIVKGEDPVWRKYLFTEFHVHSHHNPWPQRAVRNDRYKLIHNPLAGTANPGYDFSMTNRPKSGEAALLAKASSQVKKAYAVMKQPPEYELYDLKTDPFEFNNLAEDPAYDDQLNELVQKLRQWQEKTGDALSNADNARRLFDMIRGANLNREKTLPYKEFMNLFLQ
jgi:N-sulfoglucosamine sulfohydrolase